MDTSTTSPAADTTPPPPADTTKTSFEGLLGQVSSEQANDAIVAMFSNLSAQDLAELRPELLKLDRITRWNLVTMLLDDADRGNIVGVLKSWLSDQTSITDQARNTVQYYIDNLQR